MDGDTQKAAIARLRGKANKVHNILVDHAITIEEATAFSAQIFMILAVMGRQEDVVIKHLTLAAIKVSSDSDFSETPLRKIKEDGL